MASFWIFSNPFAPRLCTEQRRGEPVGGVAFFCNLLVFFFQEEVRGKFFVVTRGCSFVPGREQRKERLA